MAFVRSTACLFAVVMGLLCIGLAAVAARADSADTYDTAIAEGDAALNQGKKAEAAHRYADAVRIQPNHADIALKAAGLFSETGEYLDAAAMAALARDTTQQEEERKAASQLLETLRPHYQKEADLSFFRALRQTARGQVARATSDLEKISRLVYDPVEGRLTLAFLESAAGNKMLALQLLKEWLATNPHTPDKILGIRLTTFYASDIVKTALEEDDIHDLLVSAFGGRVMKRLKSAISEAQLTLEPPCKTVNLKDNAVMVLVPGGPFLMGQKNRPDNPRHEITLTGYWIYEKPVTVAEYKKFCLATARQMPPEPCIGDRSFNPRWSKTNHPIVNVSWDDAMAYCKWAGVRLPTEAEWEKAARGVEGWKYPWGDSFDPGLLHHSVSDGDAGGTAPVGSFPRGVSPYGALDMAGNVFQWCADYYSADYWRHPDPVDPKGPASGKSRAVRAGSWYDDDDFDYYAFRREKYDPSSRYTVVGFRCASGL